VLILDGEEVHAIANPDPTPSIGVHVYFGDIVDGERTLWDPDTGESMAFTTADYDRMVVAPG
jgi:predicted metal-dependent enzyme (double-stranded beta helix superfamily)